MFVFATIGAAALYLLFIWLISAAASAWLAARKGYTERLGLMFGLILSALGFVIVLLLPGRPGSVWKTEGWFPNPGARRPLGIPALGPVSASDPVETLGPALGDIPAASPRAEPADAPAGPADGPEPPDARAEPPDAPAGPPGGDPPPAG